MDPGFRREDAEVRGENTPKFCREERVAEVG